MTYRIEILPATEGDLARLDRSIRERIDVKIRELARNPLVVLIVRVGHRREVYR